MVFRIIEVPNKVFFSANSGDAKRNGKYDKSFNAYFDKNETAYCMQHGGDTKPSENFNGQRELQLPLNTATKTSPELAEIKIKAGTATARKGIIEVKWIKG